MKYLTRCYDCGNKINVGDEQFKCPECGAICCSLKCWLEHKCGLKDRRMRTLLH